jgi:hypothetical protein
VIVYSTAAWFPNATASERLFPQLSNFRQMLDAIERIPGAMFIIKNLDSRSIYMSVP